MIPTELLTPHEECDPRRVDRLVDRLREEGQLKNPPIIARIPDSERLVVLDGATRVEAFAQMEVPNMVVQQVRYSDPGVELGTWHHVVSGMALQDFEAALQQVDGVVSRPSTLEEAREALASERAIAFVVSERAVQGLFPTGEHDLHRLRVLREIVWAYKGGADIYRASNDVWEKQAPYYPGMIALVVFPPLSPLDILSAAQLGELLPAGITRHIIPNRALNIRIPLQVLEADWSLERKEEWLKTWLLERMRRNAIRFYSESTFYFDE